MSTPNTDPILNTDECVGKTIARIDNDAANYLEIHFTDGTWIAWEAENLGHGFYGFVRV